MESKDTVPEPGGIYLKEVSHTEMSVLQLLMSL